MICMVDVWSCALGVRWQSVGLGHECSSPAHVRHRIPSLRPPCHRCPSRRLTQCHSHCFSHSTHCRTLVFFTALTKLQSHGFSSLGPVFHAHCPCRQYASTSMGLYLIGAAAFDGTFTNKSSTYTCPSCLLMSHYRQIVIQPAYASVPVLLFWARVHPVHHQLVRHSRSQW